jgi:hypothetical protein
METVLIPETEYKALIRALRKLEAASKRVPPKKRKPFIDCAFGALKDDFGTTSSVAYVSKMRKSWRT